MDALGSKVSTLKLSDNNVLDRMHSCRHTAMSEISNRIVGVEITTHYFPSDVGFTNIVVRSTRQVSGDEE